MSLEEFIPQESSEGGAQSTEVSEKFKESIKRASSGIKRTQKDEKKAKKHDMLLAGFLVQIIIDKKYDMLLEDIFKCLHEGFPSNVVLGIISLIKLEISERIRLFSHKDPIVFDYQVQEAMMFDDTQLPDQIKQRINYWVEDIVDIISFEYSNIKTKELRMLLYSQRENIVSLTSNIFIFFLKELQIDISNPKARSISDYILGEVEKESQKLTIEEV